MSTQYLLEYFLSYQYSVLTRVLILSTQSMPGSNKEATFEMARFIMCILIGTRQT